MSGAGLFFSYSRADRAFADRIVRGLRVLGVSVWWDEDMPGVDWQEELARQIGALAGVVVLWTANSVSSRNVRDEARLSAASDKLINVLYGVAQPPFPFDRVNGLPLDGWNGVAPHRGWTRFVQTVDDLLARIGSVESGTITRALAQREKDVAEAEARLREAERRFQKTQDAHGEATGEVQNARESVAAAEKEMRQIAGMNASAQILRAAQQVFDDARTMKASADENLRRCASELSGASLALSASRIELARFSIDGEETPAPIDSVPTPPTPALKSGDDAIREPSNAAPETPPPETPLPETPPPEIQPPELQAPLPPEAPLAPPPIPDQVKTERGRKWQLLSNAIAAALFLIALCFVLFGLVGLVTFIFSDRPGVAFMGSLVSAGIGYGLLEAASYAGDKTGPTKRLNKLMRRGEA